MSSSNLFPIPNKWLSVGGNSGATLVFFRNQNLPRLRCLAIVPSEVFCRVAKQLKTFLILETTVNLI
jgi:hypothetical protein